MGEPTAIGIHIQGTDVRRAVLRRNGAHTEVVRLDRLSGPEQEAAGAGATNAARCIAALSAPDVISRCWTLPAADDTRLGRIIAHRLEADLPVPADQLTWAFRALGPAEGGGQSVLVQAARTEAVTRHLARLARSGLTPDALTSETEAIAALYRIALEPTAPPSADILVLATEQTWLVAAIVGGHVWSVRRLRAADRTVDALCRECHQAVAAAALPRCGRILWCASAALDEAREPLARITGLDVVAAPPLDRLAGADGSPVNGATIADYGPAIGLALAGLHECDDLLRLDGHADADPDAKADRWARVLAQPAKLAGLAAAITILATVLHVGAYAWEASRMRDLIRGAEASAETRADLAPKIRAMNRHKQYRIDVEAVAVALAEAMPNNVVVSSMQLVRGRALVIKGTAQPPTEVFKLADTLRKSPRIWAVHPERTAPGTGGAFTLSAVLVGVHPLEGDGAGGVR